MTKTPEDLRRERAHLQVALDQLERRRKFLNNDIKLIRRKCYYESRDLERLRSWKQDIERVHKVTQEKEQNLVKREAVLEQNRQKLSRDREKTTKSRVALRARADDIHQEARSLKLNRETLCEEWAKLRQNEKAVSKLDRQNEKDRSLLYKKMTLLEARLAYAEENHTTINSLKQKIKALKEKQTELEAGLSKEQRRNKRLKNDSRKKAAQIDDLESEVDSIKRERKNLKASLRKTVKELSNPKYDFPYLKPHILDWLLTSQSDNSYGFSQDLVVIGEGPFDSAVFYSSLENVGFKLWEKADDVNEIVVGRKGWKPEELDDAIQSCPGIPRVYSQEMFLASYLLDEDPFDSSVDELLVEFAEGHPALEYLMQAGFEWPHIGHPLPDSLETFRGYQVDESPLTHAGYHVGLTHGLPLNQRRQILAQVFEQPIEWVHSDEYMEEWGRPRSRKRLWRMAHHLAWLIRIRLRLPNLEYAVADWEEDREWLRKQYFRPWMKFTWPYN
jgi:hypothetical protein